MDLICFSLEIEYLHSKRATTGLTDLMKFSFFLRLLLLFFFNFSFLVFETKNSQTNGSFTNLSHKKNDPFWDSRL